MDATVLSGRGTALDNVLELIVGRDAWGHSAPVDVAELVDKLGRDLPVPDIEHWGKCTYCGAAGQAWGRVSRFKPPVGG